MLQIRASINGKGYDPVFYAEVWNQNKDDTGTYRVSWEMQHLTGRVQTGKFDFSGWDRSQPVCDMIAYVAERISKEVRDG